jgi:hypothetical protein
LPMLGSALQTLRDIVGLPDALGVHPCECSHPEMRRRGVTRYRGD